MVSARNSATRAICRGCTARYERMRSGFSSVARSAASRAVELRRAGGARLTRQERARPIVLCHGAKLGAETDELVGWLRPPAVPATAEPRCARRRHGRLDREL